MCKAIEDMMNDSRTEGERKGKAEGRAEGRAEGILETLAGLVKDGLLSIKDAALRAHMTESEFEAAMKKLS